MKNCTDHYSWSQTVDPWVGAGVNLPELKISTQEVLLKITPPEFQVKTGLYSPWSPPGCEVARSQHMEFANLGERRWAWVCRIIFKTSEKKCFNHKMPTQKSKICSWSSCFYAENIRKRINTWTNHCDEKDGAGKVWILPVVFDGWSLDHFSAALHYQAWGRHSQHVVVFQVSQSPGQNLSNKSEKVLERLVQSQHVPTKCFYCNIGIAAISLHTASSCK